ncbi:hypothetical protein PoB_004498500 [Plakobranchus ocellatus]|uniref:Uncharacterized protein n=1 Tax=Plakobranchus ocellatus TaxID=259542 RepID=A0AAV4BHB2_9GAST|nr:hypothetical protein PoB_004498500 [Plakobranchus ocellatus]
MSVPDKVPDNDADTGETQVNLLYCLSPQTNDHSRQNSKSEISRLEATVVSETPLRSSETFCRRFKPHHRRPGLGEGLKA